MTFCAQEAGVCLRIPRRKGDLPFVNHKRQLRSLIRPLPLPIVPVELPSFLL